MNVKVAAPPSVRNMDDALDTQARLNELCGQVMDVLSRVSLQELTARKHDSKPMSTAVARMIAAGYRQIARDLELDADEDDRRGR